MHVMDLLKWQEEYLDYIKKMSDSQLTEEIMFLAGGDDINGHMTVHDLWKYKQAQRELYSRS